MKKGVAGGRDQEREGGRKEEGEGEDGREGRVHRRQE